MTPENVETRPAALLLAYGDKTPRIAPDAFVAPGSVIVGDVEIASGASIWFNCTLRADEAAIRIGARSNLQDGTVVHVHGRKQGTTIGSDVTVGHMVLLHACTLEDGAARRTVGRPSGQDDAPAGARGAGPAESHGGQLCRTGAAFCPPDAGVSARLIGSGNFPYDESFTWASPLAPSRCGEARPGRARKEAGVSHGKD